MQVGVLALQGAFAAHSDCLTSIGVQSIEVRTPEQLSSVDALLMPGGESSTMSQLLESSGLFDPIATRIALLVFDMFGECDNSWHRISSSIFLIRNLNSDAQRTFNRRSV